MLSSKARSYLRMMGNELEPVVYIGREGVSEAIISQADGVLETRELVKVRLLPDKGLTARAIAEILAGATGADIVQVVGNNFLLFRASVKKPRIELPAD
ncbi:MAG TPA: ribosome assembly RNA-binding protein YhbY [Firmicutes bacterium]|nr:ribosome assembly RNA-binding protein YhbY [Bacillota bacterium]HAW70566.1 ribosome assembly RNA-binding protein YhbY [Bacillota bacterium]HAZ22973.1 ribosome assembly RNA-binding protein YhbY [Bacillota bacterium]HBG45073.1 ribosome assembly RNA-binding protein YhbY [Bacillota bacterium]HBL49735.1 ribosome assembly RNA-binding protein YhbY [Bacillota bacterium]